MSKLDELIAELCPNGVEYKFLGEVCKNIFSGKNKSKTQKGEYPVYGSTGIIGYSESFQYNGEQLLVARVGANAGFVQKAFGEYDVSDNTLIVKPKIEYNVLFAYYQLLNMNLNSLAVGGGQPLVTAGKLKQIKIPLPPLPVQIEIVRILDNFTELTAELTAKLTAELIARKQQYKYYRDKLLTFDDEIEWKTLGEIAMLVRGNGLQKKDFTDEGIGCIHYGQIYTYYGTSTTKTKSFVSAKLAKKLKKVNRNDIIITNTSENVEDVCKAVAWLGDNEIVTGGHATIIKHNENAKFLVYYTQTSMFFEQKRKFARGTKVIDVSATDLAKIKIPVPPLAEQKRIVAILDRFDILVNDITQGLSAEIEARQKQYEYYRDKLLTFKEVKALNGL
ncbi:restriction endonuclease subunit S [Clostridium tyrobutyricum]|uniref:restriction endonuclease subunit S n=1 Tax=Clostridium tyrobutyricum TaxID=1519 RepID=UPI00073DB157|nr:restriction endonuclease subunit S [Clostridium tyrobutyricum]